MYRRNFPCRSQGFRTTAAGGEAEDGHYDAAMLTDSEIAEMRAKALANSDRDKATGKPVGIVSHIGGPLDGLTIVLAEPTPTGGFYGWCSLTPLGLVQSLYSPGARPGVWRFDHYVDHRGAMGKPVDVRD